MGFLLVHERMLESFVVGRDRFLKEDGLMMPSTGTIFVSPFSDETLYNEQVAKASFWQQSDFYGVDITSLHTQALEDTFGQPVVGYFDASLLLRCVLVSHTLEFHTQPSVFNLIDSLAVACACPTWDLTIDTSPPESRVELVIRVSAQKTEDTEH
jgi:hypothetical protein